MSPENEDHQPGIIPPEGEQPRNVIMPEGQPLPEAGERFVGASQAPTVGNPDASRLAGAASEYARGVNDQQIAGALEGNPPQTPNTGWSSERPVVTVNNGIREVPDDALQPPPPPEQLIASTPEASTPQRSRAGWSLGRLLCRNRQI